MILTLTLQAKKAGEGSNPSYLNMKVPDAIKIPIIVNWKDSVA